MAKVRFGGTQRWSSHATDDEDEGAPSDMGDSSSPNSGLVWNSWRLDDLELESNATIEGEVNKKRKKRSGTSANGLLMGDASNATPDL